MYSSELASKPIALLLKERDTLNDALSALERDRRLPDRTKRIETTSASIRKINQELNRRGYKK